MGGCGERRRFFFPAYIGAGVLLAAALSLLAPGPTRADNECGTFTISAVTRTCTGTTYPDGIYHNIPGGGYATTLNVRGSAATTTTAYCRTAR